MKEKFKELKKKKWLFPLIILVILIIIPSAVAFYYTGISGAMKTSFKIEYDSVFVRARIVTYWVDPTTEEIVAKSSWAVVDQVPTTEWTKIDDHYYYNGIFSNTEVDNNILDSHPLISESTPITDIAAEDLTGTKYIPKYKVVYELLEATNESGTLSCEEAWGITYSSSFIPSLK